MSKIIGVTVGTPFNPNNLSGGETIPSAPSNKIWELDAGMYRVSGEVSYGKFESSVKTNSINLINKVGFLIVGLNPSLQKQRDFYLFADNKIYFGYSVDMGLKIEGDILSVVESNYILPIGGDELGGVKNGGNVVINEDGTMTAPESGGSGENPAPSGSGINSTAINLLIEILQTAIYSTNVSGKIEQLQNALASGGGGTDIPTASDDITVTDGIMTIVSVGSEVNVTDSIMTIL